MREPTGKLFSSCIFLLGVLLAFISVGCSGFDNYMPGLPGVAQGTSGRTGAATGTSGHPANDTQHGSQAGAGSAGVGAVADTGAGMGDADSGVDDTDAGAAGSPVHGGIGGAGGAAGTGDTCEACERVGTGSDNCPMALTHCDQLTDVTTGTFMPGLPRSALCHDILDCIHASHCAKEYNATDCLCGTNVPSGDCFAGTFEAMSGPCKTLIAAGGESNIPAELSLRFSDAMYPVGAAITLLENCDYVECGQCL